MPVLVVAVGLWAAAWLDAVELEQSCILYLLSLQWYSNVGEGLWQNKNIHAGQKERTKGFGYISGTCLGNISENCLHLTFNINKVLHHSIYGFHFTYQHQFITNFYTLEMYPNNN